MSLEHDNPKKESVEVVGDEAPVTETSESVLDMVSEGGPVAGEAAEAPEIFLDESAATESEGEAQEEPEVKLPKTIIGPMPKAAFVIALGWLVVAVVVLAFMSGSMAWIIGGVAIFAGLVTAYIGLAMTVRVSADGVKLFFGKLIPWDQIVGIRMVPMVGVGKMLTPMLEVIDGRAIKEVELEGLACSAKRNGAQRRAEIIAKVGDLEITADDDEDEASTPRRLA